VPILKKVQMKKIFFTLFCSIFSFYSFSQEKTPTYPTVLRTFFNKYIAIEEYENYTSFAKKKDGWYVQQVDRYHSDSLLREILFWSLQKNEFLDISLKYQRDSKQNIDSLTQLYLTDVSSVYGFERCIYYGYNSWDEDVITELENVKLTDEKSLESLARAYVSLSNKYLWHQYGGFNSGEDSLKRKLLPLELPSKQRVEKVNYFMQKSIDAYKRIAQLNPSYLTLVGDIRLKVFNETMHGYSQMYMCGRKEDGNFFLNNAILEQPHIDQAKNYLNSCDSNAILFTYGDNDTYQLWYVQEKENFRKDVSVLNTSLLGLPIYIEMLKKSKNVVLTTPTNFYKQYGSGVSYYKERKNVECGENVLFDGFEKIIYTYKFPMEASPYYEVNNTISTYPCKHYLIPINYNCNFKSKFILDKTPQDIDINLRSYLFLSDLILLNIVKNNTKKRPVYFTSKPIEYFPNATLAQGLVEKLVNPDLVNQKGIEDFVEQEMEFFLNNTYRSISGNDTIQSFDADNFFMMMYSNMVDYYVAKNDFATAKKWTNKALSQISDINKLTTFALGVLARIHFVAKDYKEAKLLYTPYFKKITKNYFEPKAIENYKSKSECLSLLKGMKLLLNEEKISVEEVDALIKKLESE
jgi:hypothetical protein